MGVLSDISGVMKLARSERTANTASNGAGPRSTTRVPLSISDLPRGPPQLVPTLRPGDAGPDAPRPLRLGGESSDLGIADPSLVAMGRALHLLGPLAGQGHPSVGMSTVEAEGGIGPGGDEEGVGGPGRDHSVGRLDGDPVEEPARRVCEP